MSDNNPSGASATTSGAASTGENPGFGAFGASRGSGLARGKRAASVAASPAPAAPSGYKPSSLEVITPKSEYVNPFTGETAVSAPRTNEPAPQAAPPEPVERPRPEPVERAPVAPAPAAPAATITEAPPPAPAPAPAGDLFPLDAPAAPAQKPSLNILPPEEPKRPAVSWESGPSGAPAAQPQRREERSNFQPSRERRDGRPFEPREPRRDERKFEPRDKQPYQPREERGPRPEAPAAEKKSGGFLGWLKGLFGGKSAEAPAASNGGEHPRHDRDGEHGGRRRHRGGRGRGRGGFQGDNRGPRDGQGSFRAEGGQPQPGGGDHDHAPGGEPRGEGFHGGHGGGGGRRRRRGGRGRFRGEGGGERGPRPEGQQGGGAI